MTITRYRLVFADGVCSGWTTDKKQIEEDAEFFGADIEVWEVELP